MCLASPILLWPTELHHICWFLSVNGVPKSTSVPVTVCFLRSKPNSLICTQSLLLKMLKSSSFPYPRVLSWRNPAGTFPPETVSLILSSSDREPEPLFDREEAFNHKPLFWPDGEDYIKMERYFVGHHVLSKPWQRHNTQFYFSLDFKLAVSKSPFFICFHSLWLQGPSCFTPRKSMSSHQALCDYVWKKHFINTSYLNVCHESASQIKLHYYTCITLAYTCV